MLEAVKLLLRRSLRSAGDAPTFLQYWKALTLQERHESEQASQFVRRLDRPALKALGLKLQKSQKMVAPIEYDWFEQFWAKRGTQRNF